MEIGPGTGVLTDELLETGAKVVAVEKDRDLFPILKQRFGQNENFQLVEADILDFDPRVSSFTFQASSFKVCGNLPYYLSGKILELILEQWREPSLTRPKLELAVFMLQKEVCQKLVAAPPQMTILSVINRFLAEFRILFLVSRKNFSPQPKVDSAVVKIVPKKQNVFEKEPRLKSFIKVGFAYPRKYLVAGLSDKLNLDKAGLRQRFSEMGISEKIRPGELSLEAWLELYKKILK